MEDSKQKYSYADEGDRLDARTIIAFGVFILIMFCLIMAFQAFRSYQNALEEGRINSVRLCNSMSDHISLTLAAVDANISRAIEKQHTNALFGGTLPKDMENNFRMWVNKSQQMAGMFMLNAKGSVEAYALKSEYAELLGDIVSVPAKPYYADR